MSNQQSGFPGQPPYGQQPQQPPYGQAPYGGYPPPPPPPRGGNKAGVIVGSVVGALVLIGAGVFVVSRFAGGDDSTRPAATVPANDAPTQPTATPPLWDSPGADPSARPSTPPSSPARPPAKAVCNGCFPGITVGGIVRTLKSKGYTCTEDRVLGIECVKGKLEIGIDRDYTEKNFVESIDVGGRATGPGDYPQGPGQAFATLRAGLPGVLPLAIQDPAVRQQIVAFTARHAGQADHGPSTVKDAKFGGYRVSIHGVSGAKVGKNGRFVSTYSTSVNIYGPSAY